ncbi:hypothetical protein FOA52_013234 [Chlamydomonas sp. UWO 241]|nr:hypothetical protein FOA52_013234 [Chlamydomonas sp. UWO 241]
MLKLSLHDVIALGSSHPHGASPPGSRPGSLRGASPPASLSGSLRGGSSGLGAAITAAVTAAAAAAATPVAAASTAVVATPASADRGGDSRRARRPDSYKSLYRELVRLEQMVGTWRGVGSGAASGTLFHVGWAAGHLECVELVCGTAQLHPLPRLHVCRIGPQHPLVVADVFGAADRQRCVIKEYPASAAARPVLSAAAVAACAVAAAPVAAAAEALGSSPPSSFGYELGRFMQASVAQTRSESKRTGAKSRLPASAYPTPPHQPAASSPHPWSTPPRGGSHARSRGGSYSGSGVGSFTPSTPFTPASAVAAGFAFDFFAGSEQPDEAPVGVPAVTHTLARVPHPRQSRQHPLAGLWKGVHGRHGAQVLSVRYNFQNHSARIVATKVSGGRDAPAGVDVWRVGAAPLPLPWSDTEHELLGHWQQLSREAESDRRHATAAPGSNGGAGGSGGGGGGGGGGALAFLGFDLDLNGEGGGGGGGEGGGGGGGGGSPPRERPLPQVTAIYTGMARPAGAESEWVDARLWLYDGGDAFALVCLPHLHAPEAWGDEDGASVLGAAMVECTRADGDTG